MSNLWFKFKQFTVEQVDCAMKISTDSVLLGAWCDVCNKRKALDIGTGTGIISMMIAQRNESLQITGIDIDEASVLQAKKNVCNSQFKDRIFISKSDFRSFSSDETFDLIVSNPPYYEEKVFCPDEQRNNARHTESLEFPDLIFGVRKYLESSGTFAVIIPTKSTSAFISMCNENNLFLYRKTQIYTTARKEPKRTLLEFKKTSSEVLTKKLFMRNEDSSYTEEYKTLTKDFYL